MSKINEATDTDPCLILAEPAPYLIRGTSLKVIDPVRIFFSNRVERLLRSCWKRGIRCSISRRMSYVQNIKRFLTVRKALDQI